VDVASRHLEVAVAHRSLQPHAVEAGLGEQRPVGVARVVKPHRPRDSPGPKPQERELRELGVRSLSLFGSVARDQAAPGSDVDLLVEFDRPVGYFHLFEVQDRLETFLGCKVDLVTPGGLRPELRQDILAEAVRAA
jgi:uncharacterized protein